MQCVLCKVFLRKTELDMRFFFIFFKSLCLKINNTENTVLTTAAIGVYRASSISSEGPT